MAISHRHRTWYSAGVAARAQPLQSCKTEACEISDISGNLGVKQAVARAEGGEIKREEVRRYLFCNSEVISLGAPSNLDLDR